MNSLFILRVIFKRSLMRMPEDLSALSFFRIDQYNLNMERKF
ncbi:hypothetical protein TREVI0001_1830 [Treponema vincentii ATCC 35580]|uniref:Uncharacterized protein n=1 Tax=Treponema vincentii ATCC 35580 TaxID=596324 RepID=C8PP87_9SPIR|nr:hypothetical protein TREVI0001_1830 [Treponema vincentii ATCC 35580]